MSAVRDRPNTRRVTEQQLKDFLAEWLGTVEQGGPLVVDATHLRCPGCEQVSPILGFIPLEYSEKYASQVIPPLKCRKCRHVFALKP